MSTIYVSCTCGQRLRQQEQAAQLMYWVQFLTADVHKPITHCPQCRQPLYPLFRAGELRACA